MKKKSGMQRLPKKSSQNTEEAILADGKYGQASVQTCGKETVADPDSMEKVIAEQLDRLIPENEPLLVAFSGGMDSRVLLEVLARLGGHRLRVLHVNHNIRPQEELGKEREIVVSVCRKLNVPLTVATIKPEAIGIFARERNCGIEAAARRFRYRAIQKTCESFRIRFVVTAHTADDQVETLLYRFLKGASLESLRAIPQKRKIAKGISVVRPMLSIRRKDIEAYIRARALAFSEDSTNSGLAYVRNRLRHLVIPALEQSIPGWQDGLVRSTLHIMALAQEQQDQAKAVLKKAARNISERTITFPRILFTAQPFSVQKKVLRSCLQWATGERHISERACMSAVSAINRGTEQLDCCGALIANQQDLLIFSPKTQYRKADGYCFVFEKPGVFRLGEAIAGLQWEQEQNMDSTLKCQPCESKAALPGVPEDFAGAEKSGKKDLPQIFLYEGSFSFPLVIRSRKAGDTIKTENGHAAIDDILKNWHIQNNMRDLVPIIEDREGIVAVLPALLGTAACNQKRFRPFHVAGNPGKLHIILKGVSYLHV